MTDAAAHLPSATFWQPFAQWLDSGTAYEPTPPAEHVLVDDKPTYQTTQKSNGTRPFEPETLRAKLRVFASKYADQDGDAPTDKVQQQMIAACLDKVCGDSDRRHTFTHDVFMWQSTADMKLAQFHALNKWLGLPKSGDFEMYDEDLELCGDEANRLVNSVINSEAVGTLFEEEEELNDIG